MMEPPPRRRCSYSMSASARRAHHADAAGRPAPSPAAPRVSFMPYKANAAPAFQSGRAFSGAQGREQFSPFNYSQIREAFALQLFVFGRRGFGVFHSANKRKGVNKFAKL